MEPKDILWEAYKILRDVCEGAPSCGKRCPLYETCYRELHMAMPHHLIKDFHYDLFVKPLFEKGENENVSN